MKTKALVFGLLLTAGLGVQANAQSKDTSTSTDGKVGKTVNKIGNKTAKTAVKVQSSIKDKKHDSKVGPDGQTIYIDGQSQYYYVDAKGKKRFVNEHDLKDK
jgi:hypothetical protein